MRYGWIFVFFFLGQSALGQGMPQSRGTGREMLQMHTDSANEADPGQRDMLRQHDAEVLERLVADPVVDSIARSFGATEALSRVGWFLRDSSWGTGPVAGTMLGEYNTKRDRILLAPCDESVERCVEKRRVVIAHELFHAWLARWGDQDVPNWDDVPGVPDKTTYGYGVRDEQQAEAFRHGIERMMDIVRWSERCQAQNTASCWSAVGDTLQMKLKADEHKIPGTTRMLGWIMGSVAWEGILWKWPYWKLYVRGTRAPWAS